MPPRAPLLKQPRLQETWQIPPLPSPPPFKSAASPTPAGRRAVRRFRLPRHRQAGACRTLRPGGPRRARTHAVRCVAQRAARRGPQAFSWPRARTSRAPGTAAARAATNGVVLATEKKVASTLVDESSLSKICELNSTTGVVYSGMSPDFRVLVAKGRKAAAAYHTVYKVSVRQQAGRASGDTKDDRGWLCHGAVEQRPRPAMPAG